MGVLWARPSILFSGGQYCLSKLVNMNALRRVTMNPSLRAGPVRTFVKRSNPMRMGGGGDHGDDEHHAHPVSRSRPCTLARMPISALLVDHGACACPRDARLCACPCPVPVPVLVRYPMPVHGEACACTLHMHSLAANPNPYPNPALINFVSCRLLPSSSS